MEPKIHRLNAILIAFGLFIVLLRFGSNITGHAIFSEGVIENTNVVLLASIILVALFAYFIITSRGKTKDFLKSLISAFAIFCGFFAIIALVRSLELFVGVVSLTFGLMAIIWTLRANAVLSKGSSLKAYTVSFFWCLLLIMLYSLWDTGIFLFELEGLWIFPKYVLLSVAYIIFFHTSYKIFKLGKEFGFAGEALRIKHAIDKKPIPKRKVVAKRMKKAVAVGSYVK